MRHRSRWRLPAGFGILAGALTLSASGFAAPALASSTGPVSTTPATGTPAFPAHGALEEIHELKQCGNTMYAVGNFSTILQGGASHTRHNIFSFSATAPYTLESFDPDVNGTVEAIAFDGGNCGEAYIGGTFTKVGGTTVQNLAEISTSTGAVITSFRHFANNSVYSLAVHGSHLLTGGSFTNVNGSKADPYYASLNVSNGNNDGYLNLHISGNYEYSGVQRNTTKIFNQQISHAGARVMVEGVFTSAGGQARQQIFQLWLGPNGGQVTGWTAPIFNTHCTTGEPFYARYAAWSPSDTEVYVASTGNHVYLWNDKFPLTGPCDSASAYSASEQSVNPAWINYTGCDSLYSVTADSSAVYFGGHPRWSENADGCDRRGPGAVTDPGLQGLNPSTGKTLMNAKGTLGQYHMSRANAFAMNLSSAGLWVGSTNRFGSNMCQGTTGLSGICFLPYN